MSCSFLTVVIITTVILRERTTLKLCTDYIGTKNSGSRDKCKCMPRWL